MMATLCEFSKSLDAGIEDSGYKAADFPTGTVVRIKTRCADFSFYKGDGSELGVVEANSGSEYHSITVRFLFERWFDDGPYTQHRVLPEGHEVYENKAGQTRVRYRQHRGSFRPSHLESIPYDELARALTSAQPGV